MSHPESEHPWHQHRPYNKRLAAKDTRQHSPCRTCFADCISDETTAVITFTCPRGHQHTTTRGDSIRHSGYLARYTTGRADQ